MRDGSAHDHRPGTRIDGSLGIGWRMHVAFADDGKVGELAGGLLQQGNVGTLLQSSSVPSSNGVDCTGGIA